MLTKKYLARLHWFIFFCFWAIIFLGGWLVVGYFLPVILSTSYVSNSTRAGIIFRNENWSGDIHIVGDLWAFPGTTVTIEPGTKIKVASSGDRFNLHWMPWELLSGLNTEAGKFGVKNGELFWDERQKIQTRFARVYALGTKEQPIIWTSDSLPGSPYDFNFIYVDRGILSHVILSNYRRFMVGDKVTVRDSQFSRTVECAVCAFFAGPTITNNIFSGTIRQYIWVIGGSPKISDNLFLTSQKAEGVVVDPRKIGAPVIYHNSFEMSGTVLRFLSGEEDIGGAVAFNIFTGDSLITMPCDSRAKFIQNKIAGRIKFDPPVGCSGSLVLGPNYWHSIDREAILREKVVNSEPKFKVLLPMVMKEPPLNVGRRLE